jgi:hypothetical protein
MAMRGIRGERADSRARMGAWAKPGRNERIETPPERR